MRITERQIHQMISYLTTLHANAAGEEFTILTLSSQGKKDIESLLNDIINQQSDQMMEIIDEQ